MMMPTPRSNVASIFTRLLLAGNTMKLDTTDFSQTGLFNSTFNPEIASACVPDSNDRQKSQAEYKVLVIDDSHIIEKLLSVRLDPSAPTLNLEIAASCTQALELAAHNPYDVIFLGMGLTGIQTCTQLRSYAHLKKTPIIMLSSKDSPIDEAKAVIAGCTTCLHQPIAQDEFQKMLCRICKWVDGVKQEQQTLSH